MEDVELTTDNYKEYIIERINLEGKRIIEIKDGITKIHAYSLKIFDGISEIIVPDSVRAIYGNMPKSIEKIKLSNNLKEINSSLFEGCDQLKEITIPEGVESIEDSAFKWCSNLKYVILPESLLRIKSYAFWKCENLEKINIPKGLKSLGHGVFIDCEKLQEIEFFTNIINLSDAVFSGCLELKKLTIPSLSNDKQRDLFKNWDGYRYRSNNRVEEIIFLPIGENVKECIDCISNPNILKKVVFPEGMKRIISKQYKDYTMLEDVVIPSTVESIDANAFENCKKIKKIILPNGLKCIKEEAFKGCFGLEEIIIPDSVEIIEKGAFEGCDSLKKVQLSSNLKTIGENTFTGCSMLDEITIPESVEIIEGSAFENCESLKKLRIPKNVKSFCINTLKGCKSLKELYIASNVYFYENGWSYKPSCNNLKRVVFEEGVEQLPNILLDKLKENVEEIVIPKTVKEIKDQTFKNFRSLVRVILPDSLEELGDEVFGGCINLESINLPRNLRKIPYKCFYQCISLQEIDIPNGLKKIEDYAFCGCEKITNFRVPETVRSIGNGAFKECDGIKELVLPKYLDMIPSELCESCNNLEFVKLPETVMYVGRENSSIENLVIGSNGVRAFSGCKNLKKVILPSNLSIIFESMFFGCKNLSEIELPSEIEHIESKSFEGSGINILKLPEGIKTIEPSAFKNCKELSIINFPYSLEKVINAFEGCKHDVINSIPCRCKCIDGDILECVYPEDIQDGVLVVPKGVRIIKSLNLIVGDNNKIEYTYWGKKNLIDDVKSIRIQDGVLRIENSAIQGYPNVKEITMSDSVLEIGEDNFQWCEGLKDIRLSRQLKNLPLSVYENLVGKLKCFIIPDSVEDTLELDKRRIKPKNREKSKFAYYSNCMPFCGVNEGDFEHIQEGIGVTRNEITINYSYMGNQIESVTEKIFGKKEISTSKVLRMGDIKHLATLSEYSVDGRYTAIGPCVFSQCQNLRSVNIEDGIKIIGPGAFLGCENLEEVIIPKSVEKISPYAFYGCKSLKKIKISSKEVDIGDFAFAKCESLECVSLPDKMGRIGKMAFFACQNLEILDTPKSIDIIDDCAFYGCIKLPVKLPKKVRKIGNMAFANSGNELSETDDKIRRELRELAYCSLNIPENVEEIGENAFANCTSFKMIYFYENRKLKKIKDGTFQGCTGLDDTIIFPEGIHTIGNSAFQGCIGLKLVTFPKNIITIGNCCFKDCKNLESAIVCSEENRENIGTSDSFENCDKLQITYLYDMDLKYQVDENGRIIGATKEPKIKSKNKFSFNMIKQTIRKKVKEESAEDEKREKMQNAIKKNLGNLSVEQLEQLCNIMEIDWNKDNDFR